MMSEHTQKRAEKRSADVQSIQALVLLLKTVCDRAQDYVSNATVACALASQGALAKYAEPALRIHAMSLNHQKKMANRAFGSYRVVDSLRVAARDALRAAQAPKDPRRTVTRATLRERIRALETEREILLEDLFILQRAYDLRCLQARLYAGAADPSTQLRCAKEQKEVDASFSLRNRRTLSNVHFLESASSLA